MILPDHTGCPIHGTSDWRVYHYKDRVERKCLACRRAREAKTHNNGPRCRKGGHLKTPWTWRRYGPNQHGRCLTCQYERQKARRSQHKESST